MEVGRKVPAAGGRGEGNRTGQAGKEVTLVTWHRGERGDRGHPLRGPSRSAEQKNKIIT